MGGMSLWHWIVVGVIVMLLFGRGKISEIMGDAAKGIKAFKKGMSDEGEEKPKDAAQPIPAATPAVQAQATPVAATAAATPVAPTVERKPAA